MRPCGTCCGARAHTYETQTSINKDYPDLVKAIQDEKSVCVLGIAGTGKTYIVRKALKGRGECLPPPTPQHGWLALMA